MLILRHMGTQFPVFARAGRVLDRCVGSWTSLMEGQELFDSVTDLVRDFLESSQKRENKVIEFKQPDELLSLLDLSLTEEGASDEHVLEQCRKALHFSVHTAHPRMFNTLFSGVDVAGLCGNVLATAANTNMYTYEMAPVFCLMEKEVLKKMYELIGWSRGNGIFAPGGSISNMYGMMCARYHHFPETKKKGCRHLPQMIFFTSSESHYSVDKGAIFLGLGTDNVVKIKCDQVGRMDIDDLDRAIKETKANGNIPLAVVGTAGTTVLGAFDDFNKIADLCQAQKMWFHIDAAYGGSCLMSATHRKLCTGIERADSVTWNPHKALHVPLQCSAFITRHERILQDMLSMRAPYLFQQDKVAYDKSLDTGDMSLQCGRLNDALKIWLMWKKSGLAWCGEEVDRQMRIAAYLRARVRECEGFRLVVEEEQYTNVSFWYIPPCLRQVTEDDNWSHRLNKVAPLLKAAMVVEGTMMISYQSIRGLPNFLRMVTVSPFANEADMDFVLDDLEKKGAEIVV